MKKNLLLVCCCFFLALGWVTAQTIQFVPNDTVAGKPEPFDPTEWVGKAKVKNVTTSAINIMWKRRIILNTGGWLNAVCDNNSCYPPDINTSPFPITLQPGQEGTMDVHCYTEGVPGNAVIEISVYPEGSPNNILAKGTYLFNVTTSTKDLQKDNFRLSPNPVASHFRLSGDNNDDIRQISIFNMTGRSVRQFRASDSDLYNVSELPAGVYLVRLTDKDNRIIKTLKMYKVNP